VGFLLLELAPGGHGPCASARGPTRSWGASAAFPPTPRAGFTRPGSSTPAPRLALPGGASPRSSWQNASCRLGDASAEGGGEGPGGRGASPAGRAGTGGGVRAGSRLGPWAAGLAEGRRPARPRAVDGSLARRVPWDGLRPPAVPGRPSPSFQGRGLLRPRVGARRDPARGDWAAPAAPGRRRAGAASSRPGAEPNAPRSLGPFPGHTPVAGSCSKHPPRGPTGPRARTAPAPGSAGERPLDAAWAGVRSRRRGAGIGEGPGPPVPEGSLKARGELRRSLRYPARPNLGAPRDRAARAVPHRLKHRQRTHPGAPQSTPKLGVPPPASRPVRGAPPGQLGACWGPRPPIRAVA